MSSSRFSITRKGSSILNNTVSISQNSAQQEHTTHQRLPPPQQSSHLNTPLYQPSLQIPHHSAQQPPIPQRKKKYPYASPQQHNNSQQSISNSSSTSSSRPQSSYKQPSSYQQPSTSTQRSLPPQSIIDDYAIAHGSTGKKKMKRKYIITSPLPPIHEINISEYKLFILNLLTTRGQLKQHEAEKYLDANSMTTFIKAITHDSVNPSNPSDNYELLEHLGDGTVNKSTTWYLPRRFPLIAQKGNDGVSIFSRQKNMVTSKPFLAKYCDKIALSKFIRYRELVYEFEKETGKDEREKQIKNIVLDRSMKEDVFEAFFGALETVADEKENMPAGIGYAICYTIITSIYNDEIIPQLKSILVDSKTQLKEIIDRNRKSGDKESYVQDHDQKSVSLELIFTPSYAKQTTFLFGPISTSITGEQVADTAKKIIEQSLAKQALNMLKNTYGLYRYKDDE